MTRTATTLEQIASGREAPSDSVGLGPAWSSDGAFAPPPPLAVPAICQVMAGDAVASAASIGSAVGRRPLPERRRHPDAGIFASCKTLIDKILRLLRTDRDRRLLMQMNDRSLADLGLSRDQLQSIFRQGRGDAQDRW